MRNDIIPQCLKITENVSFFKHFEISDFYYFQRFLAQKQLYKSNFDSFGAKIQIFETLMKAAKVHQLWRENSNETFLVILITFTQITRF